MSVETVGSLLADIAILIHDGLRIMSLVDKRQWGPDEHEQVRALDTILDEAKRDFQELSPLVNGQVYYENDRKPESLTEHRLLRDQFSSHIQNFKNWAGVGGPINPTWAKDTSDLGRALHRAQCRAARRIFTTGQESSSRCLGAWLVWRKQRIRSPTFPRRDRGSTLKARHYHDVSGPAPPDREQRGDTKPSRPHPPPHSRPRPLKPRSQSTNSTSSMTRVPLTPAASTAPHTSSSSLDEDRAFHRAIRRRERARLRLEEIAACNAVGRFARQGDADIAFVCDFCDGYIVWEDLESMPSTRTVDDVEEEEGEEEEVVNKEPPPFFASPPASAFFSQARRGGAQGPGVRPVVRSVLPTHTSHDDNNAGARSSIASIASSSSSTGTETAIPTPTTTASAASGGGASAASGSPGPATPSWRATGFSRSTREEKGILFAPLAIASHVAPGRGEWRSGLLCPFCDSGGGARGGRDHLPLHYNEDFGGAGTGGITGNGGGGGGGDGSDGGGHDDEDDELSGGDDDDGRWVGEEDGFEDLDELMEHLAWQHGAVGGGYGLGRLGEAVGGVPGVVQVVKRAESCVVM